VESARSEWLEGELQPQAACMKRQRTEKRIGGQPKQPHQHMELEGVHQMLCVSWKVVVGTGFFFSLSTDAKLIFGDRITNHCHADIFVHFLTFFFLCGQKDILFQHSIIFYTETV